MQIPTCTSGKDVDILATDTLSRGSGLGGPINSTKPGLKSRALCGNVCASSIANSTFLN